MFIKPCPLEQDVLFAMHGAVPFGARLRAAWHCLFCRHCRLRRGEFRAVSSALAVLSPGETSKNSVIAGASMKMAVAALAFALTAAALSYYYVMVAPQPTASARAGVAAKKGGVSTAECDDPAERPHEKRAGKVVSKRADAEFTSERN